MIRPRQYSFRVFAHRISKLLRVAFCIFAVHDSTALNAQEVSQKDVPDKSLQEAAQKLIAEVYRDEYNMAKSPAQRLALARKLIQVGIETADDATARFVLWRIARDIAAGAADWDCADSAVTLLGQHYKIDLLLTKVEVFERILAAQRAVVDYRAIIPPGLALVEQLVIDDRYDLAGNVCRKLTEASNKLGDASLVEQVASKTRNVETLKAAFDKLSAESELLQTEPEDAKANRAVGHFRCFVKGDWDKGLPCLKKAQQHAWAKAIDADLESPKEATKQIAIADEWWALSESESETVKQAMRKRAVYWYQKAHPKLSGLAREKAGKRIALISSEAPSSSISSATATGGSASRLSPAALAAAVEREALRCKTAKDALLVYKLFMADEMVPIEAKDQVRTRLAFWEDASAKELVRLGRNWVSRDEATKAREEAESLINQAIDFLKSDNGRLARENLEKASRVNPEGSQADFILGVLHCVLSRDFKKARSHFSECLRRDPDNVCALNNLALAAAMQNDHTTALRHFRRAVAADSATPELSHNIHRILEQSARRTLTMPPGLKSSYAELERRTTLQGKSFFQSDKGWLYMMPLARAKSPETPLTKDGVVTGGGSGFVIHPKYILTNRHVVESSQDFLICDPIDPNAPKLPALLVAQSDEIDVALLKCDRLNAPGVPLCLDFPGRGTDIMLLGYPEFFELGVGIKSTRGAIVGLPDAKTDKMCLYDATSNPGNSGGPVCDERGRVIAIHCAGYSFSGKLAAGIPLEQVIPFVKKHVPDFAAVTASSPELGWPEVDQNISKSTVLILCKNGKEKNLSLGGTVHSEWIEDRACVACRGTQRVPCTNRSCSGGSVLKTVPTAATVNPVTGQVIPGTKKIRETCGTCKGKGSIDCPHCSNGFDPNLRGPSSRR